MAIYSNKRSAGSINSASMSDIAFLLLIFFLVTTIFAHEKGISMILPPESAPPKPINRGNLVMIQAHANGAITIDGEQVSIGQIKSYVARRLEQNDRLVIVLETHQDADYGLMIDILDELRLAEARRVTLRKMPPPSSS